ncbi:hypothetical protein F0U60_16125 [Archangium minus]|uniref:Uncharacterized protein n=1 Tax=Archangium minus TaxID=83450 RepID=A0ABY9WP02_9BACT|nr:hypothetical protein F0U60_16125 [Archangium minus]
MSALRKERPSGRFQVRLQAALQEAEAAKASSTASKPGRRKGLFERTHAYHPEFRMLLGAALACALLVVAVRMDGVDSVMGGSELQGEMLPSRHVSFQIPGEGAGWLELPWNHGVHSGEPATVRLEAPADVNFHQHAQHLPALQLVGCDEARCVHEFTADTGASALPLRVRIDKPGRYEFRVSHASDVRQVHEHFVVVADH